MVQSAALCTPNPRLDSRRRLALSSDGCVIATRSPAGIRILADRATREVATLEHDAQDFAWIGDRLVSTTAQGLYVFSSDGVPVAKASAGVNAEIVATQSNRAVLAGRGCFIACFDETALEVATLALEADETVIGSLGGLRTVRAADGEIRIVDPGRPPLARVRLPGQARRAARILGGGAVAVVSELPDRSRIDVIRRRGGRLHQIELDVRATVRVSEAGRALALTERGELLSIDLRLGRIDRRARSRYPTDEFAIDAAGQFAAVLDVGTTGVEQVRHARIAELFSTPPSPEREALQLVTQEPSSAPAVSLIAVGSERARPSATHELPSEPLAALELPAPPMRCAPPTADVEPFVDDLEHLDAMLTASIDDAARAIVRAWDRGALAAPGIGHPFEDEVRAIVYETKGAAPEERAAIERRRADNHALLELRRQATRAEGRTLALADLAAEFELSSLALEIIAAVVAPALSAEAARLYAILANDSGRAVCDRALVQAILGNTFRERARIADELAPDAPLLASGLLLAPNDDGSMLIELTPAPALLERLRGRSRRPVTVASAICTAGVALEDLVMPSDVVVDAMRALQQPVKSPRLVVFARRGLGGTTLLASLAVRAGRTLVVIDAERLPAADRIAALRAEVLSARIRGAVPCIRHLERVATDRSERSQLGHVLDALEGPLFIRAAPGAELPLVPGFASVAVPQPSETDRLTAWSVATQRASLVLDRTTLAALARRYRVGPGTICRVVDKARANAPTDAAAALDRGVRQHVESRLAGLATRIERLPHWNQVALPEATIDSIRELIGRATHRRTVYDDWGFDARLATSRGLAALFSGPPGTGKTLVAGLVARELGLDLYRVDLAQVTSKWIGETEKNLGKIFDAAEDGRAVILFDEADSLFSKRGEVKSAVDRHANMEVNYLLQRLDSFEGIALLTTNLVRSMDKAFKRRIAMRIEFPFPDVDTRVRLWEAHLPAELPTRGRLAVAELAQKYPMTGAYIRNCVVRAAFLAAGAGEGLTIGHLVRAIEREYQDSGRLTAAGRLQ